MRRLILLLDAVTGTYFASLIDSRQVVLTVIGWAYDTWHTAVSSTIRQRRLSCFHNV